MWKQVSGYENVYEINEFGDLRRCGCEKLIKKLNRKDGYLQYVLSKDGIRKSRKIHRLVADAFVENPNNYNVVNHIDGDTTHNSLRNLEVVSQRENVQHAVANNLYCSGSDWYKARGITKS